MVEEVVRVDTDNVKCQLALTQSQMNSLLQATVIRCDAIKGIIKECGEKARTSSNINMDQITLLSRQYNDLQKVMVDLMTNGATI
jgi:uncharacterized protein YajQ (UPF0234 family)